MYEIEIKKAGPRRVLGVMHFGAYPRIGEAFGRLGVIADAAGLGGGKLIAMYFDDPGVVPEHALRSFAGVSVGWKKPVPAGLEEQRLAGGRVAILHLKGPYSGLPGAWAHLYNEWLAQSGEVPGGIPYEVHHNTPETAAPSELLTDVCVPLK